MPKRPQRVNVREIRNYAERWEWTDVRTGSKRRGHNPPQGAKDVVRLPFFIRYITRGGELQEGEVVCLSVDTKRRQRKIKFTASNEIRAIHDDFIIEIDGVEFYNT